MTTDNKHILVYVARHGTTDLNQKDCYRGPIDAPLDASGRRDAHKLAFYFDGTELVGIAHSDKQRTRETADIVAKHGHESVPIAANENLRAWNVGQLGGQPKNKENEDFVEWHVQHPDIPMPGGESLNEFKLRVRPLIADAVKTALEVGNPVLIVAHSSVIHEVGSLISNDHDSTLVEPGGVAAIYIEGGKLHAEPVFKPRPESAKREIT